MSNPLALTHCGIIGYKLKRPRRAFSEAKTKGWRIRVLMGSIGCPKRHENESKTSIP